MLRIQSNASTDWDIRKLLLRTTTLTVAEARAETGESPHVQAGPPNIPYKASSECKKTGVGTKLAIMAVLSG